MIVTSRSRSSRRRAAAVVELAVILPFLLLLLTGVVEVGRLVEVVHILSNAAREGARVASTGTKTYADVQNVVRANLTNAGIKSQTGLTIGVRNRTTADANGTTPGSYDPSAATQLDELEITVQIPFANVAWGPWRMFNPTSDVAASAVFISTKDRPLEVDATIPP